VTFSSVDELLQAAREGLTRLTPQQAAEAVESGDLIVDIRPEWQRRDLGEVPGSLIIERNHLEWRLHPTSDARVPQADTQRRWIILCTEGYTSSLAARSLISLGLDAADVDGGIVAWREAGLPVVSGPTPIEQVVPHAAEAPAAGESTVSHG
jgi:rhodanese-related sulfurtransferase